MALIHCPDCHKQVSEKAPACIHCGRPLANDLVNKPSPGSAEAVKSGRQRSQFRYDVGQAMAFFGLIAAFIVVLASGNFHAAIITALVSVGFGSYVAYGS